MILIAPEDKKRTRMTFPFIFLETKLKLVGICLSFCEENEQRPTGTCFY